MSNQSPKILVTGGAGFIGSEFVRQGAKKGYTCAVVDKLTYAADLKRLKDVQKKYAFYKVDICQKVPLEKIFQKEKPKMVIHFAAETHVDRSLMNAYPFIDTNIKGTQNLLDIARKHGIKRFIHISTDEVYGEIKKGEFTEDSPLHPNNPYSVSKAAGEMLVKSYIRTYKFPAMIVRASNNYGPWQYPEKFVPVLILKALHNQRVPVYGKGRNLRTWLYVSDTAQAIFLILIKGKLGEIYNVGGNIEKRNIETAKKILALLNKPESLIQFVKDRPGHDFRYSLDCTKIRRLGWTPEITFNEGMHHTVRWNKDNITWLNSKLKYLQDYWKKVYKKQ